MASYCFSFRSRSTLNCGDDLHACGLFFGPIYYCRFVFYIPSMLANRQVRDPAGSLGIPYLGIP
jgi:hypothetical protein